MRLPVPRAVASPPPGPLRVLVAIAVEEEFDWDAPFDRGATATRSLPEVERAHALFERRGLRPTYFLDHPAASAPEAEQLFAPLAREDRAEVGAHLHPWVNPPHEESPSATLSFPGNLPPTLERAKLEALTALVETRVGARPTSYMAGRYGLGQGSAALLTELGYTVDASAAPPFDFSAEGGPDYSAYPLGPFWHDREGGLLGVPVSGAFLGAVGRYSARVYRAANARGLARAPLTAALARLRLVERVRLSPEGQSVADLVRLSRALVARGERVLSLTLHSPSFAPGNTPYVTDRRDLEQLYDRIDRFAAFATEELGAVGATHSELRAALVEPRSVAG